MRIYREDIIRFDDNRFTYDFAGEIVTVTYLDETDIFDFSDMPEGYLDCTMIETTLQANPIVQAMRENGILSLRIINFIPENADESEKHSEWEEII